MLLGAWAKISSSFFSPLLLVVNLTYVIVVDAACALMGGAGEAFGECLREDQGC